MNSPGLTTAWLNVMVLLALEAGLAALLTAATARYSAGAAWRRTVYQAGILAILLVAAAELSGVGRELAGRLAGLAGIQKRQLEGAQELSPQTGPLAGRVGEAYDSKRRDLEPSGLESLPLAKREGETYSSLRRDLDRSRSNLLPLPGGEGRGEDDAPDRLKRAGRGPADAENLLASSWLWLVWALGTCLVAGRACVGRCLFALFRSRRRPVTDQKILEQAQALSWRLGMKRHVRVVKSARLKGPIAFGLVSPTIGLPVDFVSRFDDASQSAILAHELAHLAAHDTFWHALADVAAALLWWHPAVWWIRRQLRLTSELAADEASLLVADGPSVLARCLLELGARLVQPPLLGELPVSGFRSHLGRRIQRLLNLQAKEWSAPGPTRTIALRLFGPLMTAIILILSTAWVVPQAITKGNDMKTMQLNWKRSLATFALLGAISGPEAAPTVALGGDQAAPTNPATTPSAVISRNLEPSAGHATFTSRLKRLDKRAQIENKLQEIVLSEVMFDGLPVSEVVKYLSQQALRLDHDQQGINFLIDPNVVSAIVPGTVDPTTGLPVPVTLDPTTGLPVPAPSEQIDVGSITIRFNLPLRHVTLKEALEAIVKVADHPIKYAVEDYGVVISARTSAEQAASVEPSATEVNPATMATMDRLRTVCIEEEANLRRKELLLQQLEKLKKSGDLAQTITTVVPDALLDSLLEQRALAEQKLRADEKEYGPQHIEVLKAKDSLVDLEKKIQIRVDGMLAGLKTKIDSQRAYVDELRAKIDTKGSDSQAAGMPGKGPFDAEPASTRLVTRAFRIDVMDRNLVSGMRDTFGITVQPPADSSLQSRSARLLDAFSELFGRLGVRMDVQGKSMFYNDKTGVLMVRATVDEQETVAAAMQTLGGGPLNPAAGAGTSAAPSDPFMRAANP